MRGGRAGEKKGGGKEGEREGEVREGEGETMRGGKEGASRQGDGPERGGWKDTPDSVVIKLCGTQVTSTHWSQVFWSRETSTTYRTAAPEDQN